MADNYNPKIIFGGDSSGAINAVSRLKSELGGLESLAKKALSFGVGAFTISSLVSMTKAVIDQGDELNKMSQKTGVAVEELSKYRYIADLSGVSNEALTKGLTALAVGMTAAATGTGATAEQYQKFGINVRNADGTMKTSGAVLAEWADKFQAMPDGVDKTNLAVDIFGKKLGTEMIPMLNLGAAGLKAMGDEAESLGLVMGEKFAKQAEEFNDNLDRMQKLFAIAGREIANGVIPALNDLITQYLLAKKAGLGFTDFLQLSGTEYAEAARSINEYEKKLETLREEQQALSADTPAAKLNRFVSNDLETVNEQIAFFEKKKKYLEAIIANQDQQDKATSNKRIAIEAQLQSKLAELAKLHAIAEGKVSAEILETDEKRTAEQIKNVEKWIASVSSAWQKSVREAAAAGEAAQKLIDQASDTRQAAKDKAADKRRGAQSPEEQQRSIQSEFDSVSSNAAYNAALAANAMLHVKDMPERAAAAAKLAAQAAKDAERAVKLADQIEDPEASAKAIERAAEIQASLLEQKAKAKKEEQSLLEADVHVQEVMLANLEAQMDELKAKAAAIKVQADIAEAQGAITTLQAQLDNLKDKTITVTVNTKNLSGVDTASGTAPGTGQQFAYGGWTGPGGKWQPAGIVHADEFVLRQEVVRQAGAKSFLALFNQIGMRALQGYANGGLVQNLRVQPIAPRAAAQPSGGTPITLVLDGHRMPVTATQSVASEMTKVFQREALKRGIRK